MASAICRSRSSEGSRAPVSTCEIQLGLTWRGRTYDITIGPERTTVRLTAGEPFP
ncbi:glycosyl hydrolase family 65 protein, partial [Streptomyces sp. NPDC056723]|uniref:glycosyl hydrolase family 65 protein n=1 Tax=Streptomyces sp. NPDC056723 TaxID=3345925 RepID=UPI0036A84BAC